MENRLSQDLDHVLAHTESLWEDVRGQRIFLTGGTGFVGTWLLESLLWANRRMNLGIQAYVLTRNPVAFVGRAPHLACDEAVTLVTGDVTGFAFPEGQFSLVVHAATEPYTPPNQDNPTSVFLRDVAGTERVLELARRRGAQRFLFTSSGAVYGKTPANMTHIPEEYGGGPLTGDTDSGYGQSKRASEFLCSTYARVYSFSAAIARLFAFVGPRLPLNANYAVGNFLRDVLAGEPVRVAGDGTPYRSYLYAADLAIWLWTILMRAPSGIPFNVGSSHQVTIEELARTVVEATGSDCRIRVARKPTPGVAPQRYVPDTTRAAQELGLHCWISLAEGIRRTYEWNAQYRAAEAICG